MRHCCCTSGGTGASMTCEEVQACMQGIAPECTGVMSCIDPEQIALMIADGTTIVVDGDGKLHGTVEPFGCKDLDTCIDNVTISRDGGLLHVALSNDAGNQIEPRADGIYVPAPPALPASVVTRVIASKTNIAKNTNAEETVDFTGNAPQVGSGFTWNGSTTFTAVAAGLYTATLDVNVDSITAIAAFEAKINGSNVPTVRGVNAGGIAIGAMWKDSCTDVMDLNAGDTLTVGISQNGLTLSANWNVRLTIVRLA